MMVKTVTIITPVYNQGDVIDKYIGFLKKQSYGFKNLEIILVNDGSIDTTAERCKVWAGKLTNIKYFENDHMGVSAARNTGIKAATGKYIFYLDADDRLTNNTIEDCVNVFNGIYNEVDLLTYPIETYYKGHTLAPHFRYKYLNENGVYDLCSDAFIGQTTMNIVVKNRFDYNVLFDESMEFSEDQKYCCEVTADRLKMGFCKTAKYIYYRGEESASGRLSGACYIFETSLKMFEDIFSKYEYVPVAYQGLFVNDIYWKMLGNIFFPYHYDEYRFQEAMVRVKALLRKCYNYVILDHPNMDYYEKYYLMRMKGENSIQTELRSNQILMFSEGYEIFNRRDMEMVLTKVKVYDTKVKIQGFLKSVFFQFYHGNIELYAIENNSGKRLMELKPSAHNYYRSHEPTQRFFAMEYECDASVVSDLRFELHLGSTVLPVGYYVMPLVPFDKNNHIYRKDRVEINLANRKWHFEICKKVESEISVWLYYDCVDVANDNGLIQYVHDMEIDDGIHRYYVLTDKRQLKYLPSASRFIKFGSKKHKELFLKADKIITAFIENNNIIPFTEREYNDIAGQIHFDVIYLQHGVLHIDMPWKYTPEKNLADKVIASSDVDYSIFLKNGFAADDIWKIKMPRFERLSINLKETRDITKRILYAPSWRSYIVTGGESIKWKVLDKKLLNTNYFKGIKAFLESDRIKKMLSSNGYVMDVKFHPIMAGTKLPIDIDGGVVRIVDSAEPCDYDLMITDFSSWMFDFIYLGIPIISYIPDIEEFRCGMNGYRNVDFMNKIPMEEICKDEGSLCDSIMSFFETGKGMDYHVCFWDDESKSTDLIYNKLWVCNK